MQILVLCEVLRQTIEKPIFYEYSTVARLSFLINFIPMNIRIEMLMTKSQKFIVFSLPLFGFFILIYEIKELFFLLLSQIYGFSLNWHLNK